MLSVTALRTVQARIGEIENGKSNGSSKAEGKMTNSLGEYIARRGLLKSIDPENEKPVYRRRGFAGIDEFAELDRKIGEAVRKGRKSKNLSRAELSILVGLSEQVYGRYERNASKMHVSRLIHVCEMLGMSPLTMLYAAAPHLWGETDRESALRFRMINIIETLSLETIEPVAAVLEKLAELEKADNGGQSSNG
jgi:transcriptional regulator with XRE-family HTH domain